MAKISQVTDCFFFLQTSEMTSSQSLVKSDYEGGDPPQMDETNMKRRALNREYARQSRLRKHKRLEDLTNEVNMLQSANKKLVESIKAKEEAYAETEVDNNILRAQTVELTDRLRFLHSIIQVAEKAKGLSVNVKIPNLKP
ncbi:hypothetical protein JHK85_006889 [Glycine max]|nr:hypothetical protein JHK85_006889 [Glycine max]KAG5071482.1 hypothetical protein JHK86_006693 [Glycine max]